LETCVTWNTESGWRPALHGIQKVVGDLRYMEYRKFGMNDKDSWILYDWKHLTLWHTIVC